MLRLIVQDLPLRVRQLLFQFNAEGKDAGIDGRAGIELLVRGIGIGNQHIIYHAGGKHMAYLEIQRKAAVHFQGTEPFV